MRFLARHLPAFFASALPHPARLLLALGTALALAPHPSAAQTSVSIHDIMVTGGTYSLPDSPYLYTHYAQPVSVSGIVVGVMGSGDYTGTVYISEPSGSWDSLVATAEGMPVFNMAALNPACAVVGATVTVVGKVVESTAIVPSDVTAANTPGTGLLPTSCTVTATNGTMTQSISVNSVLTSFGDALKYTGMTTSATFYAVAPTSGTLNEPTETVTSSGQFWATLSSNTSTNNHLFRSPGIAKDEYVPSGSPAPTWAGNPQRVLIDTTTFGGSAVNITVGQSISCTTGSNIRVGATAGIGLIDYTLGYARLLIFPTSVCTVGGTVASTTSAAADSTHFHVGTLDLNRFYSSTGASSGSVAVSSTAYATRLAKAANAIVNALGQPDILSLQEVQDLPTLTDLAESVNTLGGSSYVPYLVAGNDPNSLNLGFLVKSSTLVTDSVTQVGASSTYTTASGGSATLWERPPLVLKAEFVRVGKNYPVTVIDAHLTPRDNIGDATLGPDIRAHRAAQAAALSALVQSYQTAGANVIVAGNLNAFEFSDGYVDVTGIVDGSPASAVTLSQASSTTAALSDLNTQVAATSRYNFIERGDAVTYEHILASATVPDSTTAAASLASYVSAVTQPHFTTDFAAINANSSSTPAGLTPHDGFVVAFLIPPVPTTASISATSINFGSIDIGASTTQTVTITNTTTFASTVNVSNIAISGTNSSDFSQTSNCTALTQGQTCTITLTFTPSATGVRNGTLTVTNDSTSNPSLVATLTGTGLDTTATLTPTSADFGSVYAGGGTSTARVFTLTNTSAIALTVKGITLTGNFTETSTCGTILAAGANCTVSVVFAPLSSGALTGTLTVTNSSTANPVLTATLTGTGLPTTATFTPTTASYTNTIVGSTSASQVFTWTNTSSIPLSITRVSTVGDFTVSASTCTGTIAANASCTVSVAFTPTVLGARTGSVTVVSSSSANPTLTATLSGRGVADVEASVSALTFGNVDLSATSTAQTFTITNYTAASIALTSLSISGDFHFTSTCPATLPGLSTCTVTVTFTPTAIGARTGALTVNTSDTKYPVIVVALTGNGVDFSITASPASGSTIAGYNSGLTVTLAPLGGFSAPVTLSCTTDAGGSTCVPAPTAFTLSASTAVPVAITTTSQYTVVGYGALGRGFGGRSAPWLTLLSLLSAAAILFRMRRTRTLPRLLAGLLLLAGLGLANLGCSGRTPDRNSSPTYPGSYTYTVSATDGTITHTATYTLTVTVR